MSDIIRINVNQPARVKLTATGIRQYRQWHASLGLPVEDPKLDADGYYHDQLWSIMNLFGPAMYNGCCVPFETEIIVEPFP